MFYEKAYYIRGLLESFSEVNQINMKTFSNSIVFCNNSPSVLDNVHFS